MIDEQLWQDFHRVVNMSSRELAEWLRTESAAPQSEADLEEAGSVKGRQILGILRKRRNDLTDEDADVMRYVVDRIHTERGDELEPTPGNAAWRRQLMDIGHDPLRAAR